MHLTMFYFNPIIHPRMSQTIALTNLSPYHWKASTCFMRHKQSTSHSPYTIMLSIPWKFTALSDRNKNGQDSLEKEGCMRKVLGDDLLLSWFSVKWRLLKKATSTLFVHRRVPIAYQKFPKSLTAVMGLNSPHVLNSLSLLLLKKWMKSGGEIENR